MRQYELFVSPSLAVVLGAGEGARGEKGVARQASEFDELQRAVFRKALEVSATLSTGGRDRVVHRPFQRSVTLARPCRTWP